MTMTDSAERREELETITLTIDGRRSKPPKGMTVLEAAPECAASIFPPCATTPTSSLTAAAVCAWSRSRRCAACPLPAPLRPPTAWWSTPRPPRSDQVASHHRRADHGQPSPAIASPAPRTSACELSGRSAATVGCRTSAHFRSRIAAQSERIVPVDASNPFFNLDRNHCILCARCVRACNEITGVGAIEMAYRGDAAQGEPPSAISLSMESRSASPAASAWSAARWARFTPGTAAMPTREVKTTCPYCGVGCQMYLGVRDGEIVSVRGDKEGAANKGQLCVKGRFGIAEFVHHRTG